MNDELENIQEPVTEVTENTDGQAVEQFDGGIELTDTASSIEEKEEVKMYTQEEMEEIINKRVNERVDELLPKKIEREKRKMEREHQAELSKYKETESILSMGMGTNDLSESNKRMREFYKEQGIVIPEYQPKQNVYSQREEEILAKAEANEIIELGYDEVKNEANRLADIGYENMTNREKALFNTLSTHLDSENKKKELAKLGVKDDLLNNQQFKDFASQFNSKTPIKNIYELYSQTHQQSKKVEPIGSMKTTNDNNAKDYYTDSEIAKLSLDDLDDDRVWEAVRKSMTKQS